MAFERTEGRPQRPMRRGRKMCIRDRYPGGREPERTCTHSSVVSACAAVQAAEAEKLLTGAEPTLWGRLLMADLDSMETHVVSFCTFCS